MINRSQPHMTIQTFRGLSFSKLAILSTIAAGACLASTADAQLMAYEGFAYDPDTSLKNASGLTGGNSGGGGDSFGWASRWYGANNPIATNAAGSMAYTDLAGNTLLTDGGRVVIGVPAGSTLTSQPSRSLAFGSL